MRTVHADIPHAGEITLVDVTNGKPFPSAPSGSVLLSSVPLGWHGIIVEWHRLEPQELPEHYVVGHGLAVSTGKRPLAEPANVSPFHFARQFRATVGLAPHQFVLRQRVHNSVGPMKAGKLPLAQSALETGFHDQAHFTRTFRKVLGTTPAAYCVRR